MRDLNDLYYFVQVVEHGGFAPAGRALGVPKSKLSRRIALLEEHLGVRLLQRSTRHFSVTEIGTTYYQHCKAMLVEAEAAQEAIDNLRAEPRGVIRVTCPVALLHVHVGQIFAKFMVRYPEITLYLEATNRRVDLVSEAVDVAIRVRPPPLENSELVMRILANRGQALIASPRLFQGHRLPISPEELHGWPSLGLGLPQDNYAWVLHGPDDAQVQIPHNPRLITTDMMALRDAALAGVGIVQLPRLMVQELLAAGRLVRVAPEWKPCREIIHAVYPSRRCLLPSVRALVDYLVMEFAALEDN